MAETGICCPVGCAVCSSAHQSAAEGGAVRGRGRRSEGGAERREGVREKAEGMGREKWRNRRKKGREGKGREIP